MAATDPIFDPTPASDDASSPASAPPSPEATDPSAERDMVDEAAPSEHAAHGSGGCPVTWCPICITVGAVQPMAPDVMEHLLKAGTELFLAFRAVVDSRADGASGEAPSAAPGKPSTLEKIDLG
jgi:hypothetical protein